MNVFVKISKTNQKKKIIKIIMGLRGKTKKKIYAGNIGVRKCIKY